MKYLDDEKKSAFVKQVFNTNVGKKRGIYVLYGIIIPKIDTLLKSLYYFIQHLKYLSC